MKPLTVCGLILAWTTAGVHAEEPFKQLSVEEACRTAKQKNLVVMIDFYTTWCGPCRMLDRLTWPDKEVQRWLSENTIALKVDADRNRPLARQYKVAAYPTIIFIDADGKEIGRTAGFQQPNLFLTNAKGILARAGSGSGPSFSGSRPDNPLDRLKKARDFIDAGRHKEALDELVWCYDHGDEQGPGFASVRLSVLAGEFARLGKVYPPALDALRARRDTAERAVLDFASEATQSAPGGPSASFQMILANALEMTSINRELGEAARTLAVHEELGNRGPVGLELRKALVGEVIDLLIEKRRYDEIVDSAGDVFERFEAGVRKYRQSALARPSSGRRVRDGLDAYMRQRVAIDSGKYFEALLGVGRLNEAEELASRVIKFDPSPVAFSLLIDHAVRAKAFDAARSVAAKAQSLLSENEQTLVSRSISRIPRS